MSNHTLAAKAKEARRKILTMVHKAGTSHIASNFSVVDIATVLYDRLQPEDYVVWSKGWAAASVYYFTALRGEIPVGDLEKFPNAPYLGLAETTVNGVHVAGGSMGHGLPVAVGMALGLKRANQPGTVYCIMSDGELNEGTTWEALALADQHDLNNFVVIVDANKWQAMGKTADVVNFEPLHEKFRAFGLNTDRINGHDYQALQWAYDRFDGWEDNDRPRAIICDTIKGKGVSFFEDHLLYHYKHVTADEYEKAMAELA